MIEKKKKRKKNREKKGRNKRGRKNFIPQCDSVWFENAATDGTNGRLVL